jgi:hypothetical protein
VRFNNHSAAGISARMAMNQSSEVKAAEAFMLWTSDAHARSA